LYFTVNYEENKYEVIIMKQKQNKGTVDENLFRSMNYELAGDIGAIDNEDMLNNRKLIPQKNKKTQLNNQK